MKKLLESFCDVLIGYETAAQISNNYIHNFKYNWDGYLPISKDLYNKYKQELVDSDVDITRGSIRDYMLVTRIRLQVPKYALKYLIERKGVTDIDDLATEFGVGSQLIYEALIYYSYMPRLNIKKYYPI